MHNALNRLQNVFGFFTTVASFVALAIALVSLISTPTAQLKEGSLKLRNIQVVKGRPHYYSQKKEEYAHIKFDLDVDLSTLFTWNTKQIFLYITATYPSTSSSATSTTPPSSAIIWDAILPHPNAPIHHNQYIYPASLKSSSSSSSKSKSGKKNSPITTTDKRQQIPGLLKLPSQRPKYQITDPTGQIANRGNATLELHYNIQPWVGALMWGRPGPVSSTSSSSASSSSSADSVAVQKNDILSRLISHFTQREIVSGGRSASFALPKLKEKGEGLGTAKGGEGNRGKPA